MDQKNKKVLIIEDDRQIAKVYDIQLKKEGISTIISNDGEDAVKLVTEEKPDLIVLDLMIPKKDGFLILEEIRKNTDFSKIPIIIISNLGQQNDKIRALDLGATEYLTKVDHSIQEIISKIKEHLRV